ncbi:MAG: DUF1127 domain-containing protein [Pseudomonadota bacterium]
MDHQIAQTMLAKSAATFPPRLPMRDRIHALLTLLAAWQSRMRSRRRLAEMDAHLLRDIGLSDEQVRNELEKPFWRC